MVFHAVNTRSQYNVLFLDDELSSGRRPQCKGLRTGYFELQTGGAGGVHRSNTQAATAIATAGQANADSVKQFTDQCVEPSTRRKQESILRLYGQILLEAGLQYRPLTSRKLILFIYCLVRGKYKATTIKTYVSTVKSHLVLKGDLPLTDSDQASVKSAMRAAFKVADTDVKRAATITISEISKLCLHRPNDEVVTGMLLSFYALLRSAELVS